MRSAILLIILLLCCVATNYWATRMQLETGLSEQATGAAGRPGWNLENAQSVLRGSFWEIRRSIAVLAWAEAQTYFHGGFDLTTFSKGTPLIAPSSATARDEHDHTGEPKIHTAEEEAHIAQLENHPFLRRSALRPYIYEHSHAQSGPRRMMPFYWITTELDPYFVKAYDNGAFWLAFQFGKPDQALKYLDRGLQYNPKSYALYATRAHIYMSVLKDYAAAIRDYKIAVSLNPRHNEEQVEDLVDSLRYLGRACLLAKRYDDALRTAYLAKRVNPIALGFDSVISEATTALEGHPQE